MIRSSLVAATAAVLCAVVVPVGAAGATPAQGEIDRTEIAAGTTDAPIAIVAGGQPTTLYVQELELGAAASSGWHTHPGPEHTVINEGTVWVQMAPGCAPVAINAGQSVFIQGGVPHNVVNHGPGEAEAVVTYTLPAGQPVRIDAPAACP